MTEREKVIKGLELCSREHPLTIGCLLDCPYDDVDGCEKKLMQQALALLKAQEPRVMTLEEAKTVEGYVWTECCDTNILHVSLISNGHLLEPFEEPFKVALMNWDGYGKEWRYWTSCPDEQRRADTSWEE